MEITLAEMKAVFTRLKNEEGSLSVLERELLARLEKTLYAGLSVEDAEALMQSVSHARGRAAGSEEARKLPRSRGAAKG